MRERSKQEKKRWRPRLLAMSALRAAKREHAMQIWRDVDSRSIALVAAHLSPESYQRLDEVFMSILDLVAPTPERAEP